MSPCTPTLYGCHVNPRTPVLRRPRRWSPRGPLIPEMCSSSGSRALRPATDDLPLHRDLVNDTQSAKTLDKRRSLEWCIALMFWHPGKLQSPFLSQKSIERETPPQPWRPHTLPASVPPLSPASPVSPERSYSPAAAPVSPTPPATSGSPVQATGLSVLCCFFYEQMSVSK